jgi:hypothetical protein
MYIADYQRRRSKNLYFLCKALTKADEFICSIVVTSEGKRKDQHTENSPTRLWHSKSWAIYDSATPYQSM